MLRKQVSQKNMIFFIIEKAMSFNNVAIVYVKGNGFRINFCYMSKDDVINIMNGSILSDKSGVL